MADSKPPESPTTARPLDFDDEDHTHPASPTPAPNPPPKDDLPPPKPPRPLSAREQAENTLKEAFPTIEPSVIRAVLTASGGSVEPAFNALLEMTDPDAQQREAPPPTRPPRPTAQGEGNIESDEMYARQLQEHYAQTQTQSRPQPQQPQQPRQPRQPSRYNEELQGSRAGRPGAKPNPDDVPWRSFLDDELPEIRDNIRKGFLDTQTTVNKWLGNLKKKIDGEDEGSDFTIQPPRQASGYETRQGGFGGRGGDYTRRSADMQRYDADPQVISDDFSRLDMQDSNPPLPDRRSSRPLANPNLFKTTGGARKESPSSGRKVSFQNGPPEEIRDLYSGSGITSPAPATSATKSSKWQPLSTVDPSPVADNDPFSLGDSDDDKDAKPITLKENDSPVSPVHDDKKG